MISAMGDVTGLPFKGATLIKAQTSSCTASPHPFTTTERSQFPWQWPVFRGLFRYRPQWRFRLFLHVEFVHLVGVSFDANATGAIIDDDFDVVPAAGGRPHVL